MIHLDFVNFIRENAFYIVLALVIIIAIIVTILLARNNKKKAQSANDTLFNSLLEALGGKDNILSLSAKMSRLTVSLKNEDLLDVNKVKELGVTRILRMSKKIILLIGQQASEIEKKFKSDN